MDIPMLWGRNEQTRLFYSRRVRLFIAYSDRRNPMSPMLEDLFLGPGASPSFDDKLQFRWEDSRRRVRVIFGGVAVADSTRVMLLHESGHLPVFYFPFED